MRHRTIPAWAIILIGAVATGAALIWASGLRDEQGESLLDADTAMVLVALLGTVGTIGGLLLKSSGEVKHQVKNSHGTNLRDDIDGLRDSLTGVADTASKAHDAAQRALTSHTQLREDVQALHKDMAGQASDIRGLRKDIGRIADVIISKE